MKNLSSLWMVRALFSCLGTDMPKPTFSLDSKINSQGYLFVASHRWYKTFSVPKEKLNISKINFEVALCKCFYVFIYV